MKKISFVLVALGVFLVVAALLARFYVYERVAVMPSDVDMKIVATTAPDEPATYFDLAELEEVEGALENITRVRGNVEESEKLSESTGEDAVIWETYSCTGPLGEDCLDDRLPMGGSLSGLALGAHSSEVVNWDGDYIESNNERKDNPATGYVFKLPFDVQPKSYLYWAGAINKSVPLEYVDEGDIDGLRVMNFVQDIPATKTGTIDLPGSLVGSDEETVTGDQMVTVRTEMAVEPETGVAMNQTVEQDLYVTVDGERVLTLVDATLGVDDESVDNLIADYKPLSLALKALRLWVPIAGTVLGLLLIAAGLLLARRHSQRSAHDRRFGSTRFEKDTVSA